MSSKSRVPPPSSTAPASRIVLAYSGSLRTSVAIPWLKEKYGAEVVTATMDLGLGRELEAVRDRALASGAVRAHVLDLREEFARAFVVPALKADAAYDEGRAMAPLLGRPLIAQKLVELARMEQARAVAHGGGPAELDLAVRTLDPTVTVIATAVENAISQAEEVAYLQTRGLAVPVAVDRPYRADANLWGRTLLWAGPDDPWTDPPESIFALTRSPAACPDEPAYVDLSFERGVPTAVNGVLMPIVDLIASLGTIVGAHGVGRSDTAETRPGNVRVRTVTEAPAAVALHTAHQELGRLAAWPPGVHAERTERFSRLVAQEYVDIICAGRWFTPLREALDAFVDKAQEQVTGVVRLKLFKGRCHIVGDGSTAPPRRMLAVTPA